eukprot:11025904-Lingulodinium_polyedra.AAC.1
MDSRNTVAMRLSPTTQWRHGSLRVVSAVAVNPLRGGNPARWQRWMGLQRWTQSGARASLSCGDRARI